jgi:riboflavin synthase
MFTGIVERVANVVAARHAATGSRLEIDLGSCAAGVGVGDSIAIDGCCLTVVSLAGTVAAFDVAPESLGRTTLGERRNGDPVNVERSLRVGDRLDGHLVTGHVDGVATVVGVAERGIEIDVWLELPEAFARFVIEKGSIALSGVSLTVAEVDGARFRVMLIPHTRAITTLRDLRVGSRLAFEVDPIGKWVARSLEAHLARIR